MAGSPTVKRRRLSKMLEGFRLAAGKTATQVARELDWNASKVTRMERNEWKRPLVRDVEDLLDLYEVTDKAERMQLVTLAREGRQRGWWQEYEAGLNEQYEHFIGLEAEAAIVSTFEALTVPGLLQTEDYARDAIRAGHAEITEEQVEQRVAVRAERQKVLTRDDPLRLSAVIDEAVLRRCVGGAGVMRAQMRHLLQVAEFPRVTLQVIPFEAGLHPGAHGPFVILKFDDPADPEAVYVENLAWQYFFEEPSQIDRYQVAFQRLVAVALSPGSTIEMLAKLAK